LRANLNDGGRYKPPQFEFENAVTVAPRCRVDVKASLPSPHVAKWSEVAAGGMIDSAGEISLR